MRRIVLLGVLLVVASALIAGERRHESERVVAIADVHGAYEPFLSILTAAGLIDGNRRWAGGRAVLVQTGDVTDRGAGVREALDLLMALEQQAEDAGGRVHALLGNHEVMNMLGDTRDVSGEALKSFGGETAYRAAFAREGRYGRWLRRRPVILNLDGTVFMHAGIDLNYSTDSIDELNRRARRQIEEFDDGRRWLEDQGLVPPSAPLLAVVQAARAEIERFNATGDRPMLDKARAGARRVLPVANIGASSLLHGEGPLWFRGLATWPDAEGAVRMEALLKHHRVKRFVTGHTVQTGGRISERFNGTLFLIDTGMLNGRFFPAGRPSALEITPAGVKEIYPN